MDEYAHNKAFAGYYLFYLLSVGLNQLNSKSVSLFTQVEELTLVKELTQVKELILLTTDRERQ